LIGDFANINTFIYVRVEVRYYHQTVHVISLHKIFRLFILYTD